MAKFAYPSPFAGPNEIIDAATLTLHDKRVFYCTTPECQARMYLRNPQKNSACFVSYSINEHTGGYLCHIKDKFEPDIYSEDMFDLDACFHSILTPAVRENEPHHGRGGVGEHREIAIKSLRMLYLMCVQYREAQTYNGYNIEDILLDSKNHVADTPIIGKRIIVCTFRKYSDIEQNIYMDSPSGRDAGLLRIHVTDHDMYRKCRHKLYDHSHEKLSVIAGNWEAIQDDECIAQCELTSVGKQICRGDQ